jgi:hypothetical protein
MKAQDLEWLRDASVDLLSLDMSRWTDVQVELIRARRAGAA